MKFEIGDRVKCIKNTFSCGNKTTLKIGQEYIVHDIVGECGCYRLTVGAVAFLHDNAYAWRCPKCRKLDHNRCMTDFSHKWFVKVEQKREYKVNVQVKENELIFN